MTAGKPGAARTGERTISRDELRLALEQRRVVLLDAQAPGWYEREHLPTAIENEVVVGGDLSKRNRKE